MRYETQLDLLALLQLTTRHFTTAAFSLRVTQSFDAARILTMAAVAMVADAVVRVEVRALTPWFTGSLRAQVGSHEWAHTPLKILMDT